MSRIQSTVTLVNTIRRPRLTSLLASGEVEPEAKAEGVIPQPRHGGSEIGVGVVGDSRLGKGDARKHGRPQRAEYLATDTSGESEPPYELRSGVMPMEQRVVGKQNGQRICTTKTNQR
jgi:hypothetical protein